jgi:hypothetical protein
LEVVISGHALIALVRNGLTVYDAAVNGYVLDARWGVCQIVRVVAQPTEVSVHYVHLTVLNWAVLADVRLCPEILLDANVTGIRDCLAVNIAERNILMREAETSIDIELVVANVAQSGFFVERQAVIMGIHGLTNVVNV